AARALWSALQDRFAACKLVLHPEKTKIVYCKDANRGGDFPNQSLDFLGFTFRARKALGRGRRTFACFLPAASPKALTSMALLSGTGSPLHYSDHQTAQGAGLLRPRLRAESGRDRAANRTGCHAAAARRGACQASPAAGGGATVGSADAVSAPVWAGRSP